MGHYHSLPGDCPSFFECTPDESKIAKRAADTSKNLLDILIAGHDKNRVYLIVLLALFIVAFFTIALALAKTYKIVREVRGQQVAQENTKGHSDDEV